MKIQPQMHTFNGDKRGSFLETIKIQNSREIFMQ